MISTTSLDSAFANPSSVESWTPRKTFILKTPLSSSRDRFLMSNRFSRFGSVSFGDFVIDLPSSEVTLTENFGIQ